MQHNLVEEKMASMEGAISNPAEKEGGNNITEMQIESRFGTVTVNPQKSISFIHGMPGILGPISFCITSIPNIKTDQFRLLQCLSNPALSFITVPSTFDNQLLEATDVKDVCTLLGINKDNLLLLFIVTSHETPSGRRLSVNAKAPVFIDVASRTATQYVFQSDNYDIQHFIS